MHINFIAAHHYSTNKKVGLEKFQDFAQAYWEIYFGSQQERMLPHYSLLFHPNLFASKTINAFYHNIDLQKPKMIAADHFFDTRSQRALMAGWRARKFISGKPLQQARLRFAG